MSRPLHARWILPFALIAAGFALWQNARALHWRVVRPGLEFATIRGEPFCRRGSSAIAVVRMDPERVTLRAHHYTRERVDRALTIEEWQKRTRAHVVFNAGQYYPDLGYMGLLVCEGRAVSPRLHAGYKAALVAGPKGGGRGAKVLDLEVTPIDPATPGWAQVAQSFMLFDQKGGLRVRRTDRVANRTIVAQDGRGRLLVVVTEGGYTLADLAEVLRRAPLELTHAMSMDGGLEAEMLVATPTLRYASFGESKPGTPSKALGALVPLPAVISLESE